MPSQLGHELTLLPTVERSDAELLSAYVRGDERAFEALVRRYFGLVHATALRRLQDPWSAEEAAQSTFIILAHKAKGLSGSVILRAWLLKTARFVCNDLLKSRRRRQQNEEPLELHHGELTDPHEGGGPAQEVVEHALLSLPALEQACLVARFYEGRTFKEMGDSLGMTEDGAQKKVARSLEKLRLFLSKRGIKMADGVLSGCLVGLRVPPVPPDVVHSAVGVILGAARGGISGGSAAALAGRCLRLLTRREWLTLAGKVVVPLLLIGGGGGLSWAWSSSGAIGPNDSQMEALGKAWSVVVLRAAAAKQRYQRVPARNTPEFQAYLSEMQFAVSETTRISKQIQGALKPGEDRAQMAEFLTVEMRETLGLSRGQQQKIFHYVLKGLSNGTTLQQAITALGQATAAEAGEVKVFLSQKQRQVFDRVYGADGLCLFQYCKVGAG
jgi:RNA polymerase sigma factor (sigma-70 family)